MARSSSLPTQRSTGGGRSVHIGVGMSVGVALVLIVTAVIVVSVTVWLKWKSKPVTTTVNVADELNLKLMEPTCSRNEIELRDNPAHV